MGCSVGGAPFLGREEIRELQDYCRNGPAAVLSAGRVRQKKLRKEQVFKV